MVEVDLVALRARLDKDEACARYRIDDYTQYGAFELDPERALADIAAKRQIIDRCERAIAEMGIHGEDGQEDLALDILALLAASVADRPV